MKTFLVTTLLLLFTIFIVTTTINAASLTAIDYEVDKIDRNPAHNRFFKKLTNEEKNWIVRLVIQVEAKRISDHESNIKPLSILDKEPELKPIEEFKDVPGEIFEVMLNGEVTSQFQKDMVLWLRKKYGIQDKGFTDFNTKSTQICHNGKCWDVGEIGGECCPFG